MPSHKRLSEDSGGSGKPDEMTKPVAEPTSDPEPQFVDVRLKLLPADARVTIDGQEVELNDGQLRLPSEQEDLKLIRLR